MRVELIPVLQDNYSYLVICEKTGEAAVIDPADADKVAQKVIAADVKLKWILNTHHHADHVAGNMALRDRFKVPVAGFAADASRIPGFSTPLTEKSTLTIGKSEFKILFTPGHTRGHIAFYAAREAALFCGDTLFSAGCGRLFEGSVQEMVESLYEKIAVLPDATRVYCGHEYTLANLKFARLFEPSNEELKRYHAEVVSRTQAAEPTIPTTIGLEKKINPFLRCGLSDELHAQVVVRTPVANDRVAVFTALRRLKDEF